MKRIFITGMSGTGKSSVIEALRAREFAAIDTDYDEWCELSFLNGQSEWIWREDRMHNLLVTPLKSALFVSGCRSNQGKFYRYFDYKILLSAPLEVMLERVAQRCSNPYGKSEPEQAEICCNFEHVQPLLRKSADFELDTTTMSVNKIADFLARLTSSSLQDE
jgi:shikimate kinase